MFIGSVWHLVSAIVIGPALVVLRRLPNRGGSKRVRILSNLLFWLLLNGLLAATQKIGIIGGIFHAETYPDDPPPPPSSSFHLAASNKSASANSSQPGYSGEQKLSAEVRETRISRAAKLDSWSRQLELARAKLEPEASSYASQTGDCNYSETLTASRKNAKATNAIRKSRASESLDDGPIVADRRKLFEDDEVTDLDDDAPGGGRFKRATSDHFKPRKRQSPLVVFLCWTLSVGIKTVSTLQRKVINLRLPLHDNQITLD